MTRMEAENEAARRNASKLLTSEGKSWTAQRSLTGESEWAVVTWQSGKPTYREYAL